MVICVDTNVLVRAFVDEPSQSDLAKRLIDNADLVFIPSIVQVEFVWVLKKALKLSKDEVVKALKNLPITQTPFY